MHGITPPPPRKGVQEVGKDGRRRMAKRWIPRVSLGLSGAAGFWFLPLSEASSNPWGYGPIYHYLYSSPQSFGEKKVKSRTFDQERATMITPSNIFNYKVEEME